MLIILQEKFRHCNENVAILYDKHVDFEVDQSAGSRDTLHGDTLTHIIVGPTIMV